MNKGLCVFAALLMIATGAVADTLTVPMYMTNAKGDQSHPIGTITIEDMQYGALITPNLKDIPAGLHGFHIHEFPKCGNNGMDAGDHYDPGHTHKHAGPYVDDDHLGDLPALTADKNNQVTTPVLAPRVTTNDFRGHALIIHAGGDTYSEPPKLGGGGARIACGAIPSN